MSVQLFIRLRNPVLFFSLAAAFPLGAYAAGAASVDFSVGNVMAVNVEGKQRPLSKGAEIVNGDTISTGDGGRAQVRFTDGAMVSLQPRTDFRVDDYQYSGKADGEEKGFFSLLKGGLRTITGLVGRVNRDRYKVTTGVATIGIRGTGYNAVLDEAVTELAVNTSEGVVEVCNDSGCVMLASGESGVAYKNAEPRRTQTNPLLPPAQPEDSLLPVYSSGDERYPDGSPAVPRPTPETPPPITPTVLGIGGTGPAVVYPNVSNAVYNPDGSLQSFVSSSGLQSQGTGVVAEFGGDSIIKWQRWTDGTMTLDNSSVPLTVNQGVHLVWGTPTVNMPTTGTATYTSLGGTKPTDVTGGMSPGALSSASLTVDFGALTVSAALKITTGLGNYDLSGTGNITGNLFNVPTMTGSCAMGGPMCSGTMKGGFYGQSGERAGGVYKITDPYFPRTFVGAVAFTR